MYLAVNLYKNPHTQIFLEEFNSCWQHSHDSGEFTSLMSSTPDLPLWQLRKHNNKYNQWFKQTKEEPGNMGTHSPVVLLVWKANRAEIEAVWFISQLLLCSISIMFLCTAHHKIRNRSTLSKALFFIQSQNQNKLIYIQMRPYDVNSCVCMCVAQAGLSCHS